MISAVLEGCGTSFIAGEGEQSLVEQVVRDAPEFSLLRRDLHAHPELSYEEHRTSRIVAESR